MKKTVWMKVTAMVLCFLLLGTCLVFAEEAAPQEANEQEAVTEASVQEEAAVKEDKTIGEAAKDAVSFKLTNGTGADIVYVSVQKAQSYSSNGPAFENTVRLQEALIEQKFLDDVADGVYGPKTEAAVAAFREEKGLAPEGGADEEMLTALFGSYDDGNLLKEEDVFADQESRTLYIKAEEDADASDGADWDALREILDTFKMDSQYVVSFRLAEEEENTIHTLHIFLPKGAKDAQICMEDSVAYLTYKESGSEETVSTLEAEQAIWEFEHPQVEEDYYDYDYDYDYGYDYDYDYGYDYGYGYEDYGYVDDGPYIVSQVAFPSCDDGSHGYYEITYSDGTVTYVEY